MKDREQTPSTRDDIVSGPSNDPTRNLEMQGDARREQRDPREDRPASGDWVGAEDASAQKHAAELEKRGDDEGGASSEGKERNRDAKSGRREER